jgi:hypothetical protein
MSINGYGLLKRSWGLSSLYEKYQVENKTRKNLSKDDYIDRTGRE